MRSQTTNRQTAFQITIRGNCWLILAKRKGNLVFNMMYGKVWFDGDFFVRNLRRRGAPPALVAFSKGFFFSFLDRVVPFFLLWAHFFTNDYLPLLIFP